MKQELIVLDQEFQEVVEQSALRTILVSHAGYTYWQERYGLKQLAVTGFSPTNEPTQQQLNQIITYVREQNMKH